MNTYDFNNQNPLINSYESQNQNSNLISSQEKIFFYENTRFLWKELIKINTSLIINSKEISFLEPYVENILYSKLYPEDIELLSNDYIVQLVTLLQLIGQYFVYIQKKLEMENEELKERLNEVEEISKKTEKFQTLIETLNKNNQEKDFLIKTYQKMIEKNNGIDNKNIMENNLRSKNDGKVYFCKICSGKKFKSKKYLDEHMKRRHFNEMDSLNEYQETRESTHKHNYDKKINSLKDYFINRIKQDQENNAIISLNKKIDSLKNQIMLQNNNRNINLNQNELDLNLQNLNINQSKNQKNQSTNDLNKELNDLKGMFINEVQKLNNKIKTEKNNILLENKNEKKYEDNRNITLIQLNKSHINKNNENNIVKNNNSSRNNKLNNNEEEKVDNDNYNNKIDNKEKEEKRYSNSNKGEENDKNNESNNNINQNDNNNINNIIQKENKNDNIEEIENNNDNENINKIGEIITNSNPNNLENEQNNLRAQNNLEKGENEIEPEDNIYKKEKETQSPRFSKVGTNEFNGSKIKIENEINNNEINSFKMKLENRDNDFYQKINKEYTFIEKPSKFNPNNEVIDEKIQKLLKKENLDNIEDSKEFNEKKVEKFLDNYENQIKNENLKGKEIYEALGIDKILNDFRNYMKEKNNNINKIIIKESVVSDRKSNPNKSNSLNKNDESFKKNKNKNIFESSLNLLEHNYNKEESKQSI